MANRILLTGAGFTRNFGAPLANEMATHIFNLLKCPEGKKLKKILREYSYDYESAYQAIISGEFSLEEKSTMKTALIEAYNYLDKIIINIGNEHIHTIHSIEKELIKDLQVNYKGSGFIFTLNQDLIIERKFNNGTIKYRLPAAYTKFLNSDNSIKDFENNLYSQNNDLQQIEKERNQFLTLLKKIKNGTNHTNLIAYVKLHGSMDWLSGENNQLMIVGGNKTKYIDKFPLLKWYYELFKFEINKTDARLLIIGYGFMDEHINLAIKVAIEENALQLYIINPTKQTDFEKELSNKKYGKEILDAIKGYYPYELSVIFPNDSCDPITAQWINIKEQFFN
ncbi:SIR2 family protein [Legionella gresilensis]|uniref:SIR2 family protein n=1 Tax=Legionella gresilensis TaxID=91823 RepID=UPI0013EFBFF3|nr:SIR2 family protein [Legionella gresilensis]